jgi:glutathione S-transferase
MTEKVQLYFAPHSRPCRAVLLLIRVLGIDVEIKNINLSKGEQHNEEFKKLNPDSKIPVIVDTDGFTLSESRAILAYLVNSKSPESDLYPSDTKKRALVDQKLYYDATVIYPVFRAMWVSEIS